MTVNWCCCATTRLANFLRSLCVPVRMGALERVLDDVRRALPDMKVVLVGSYATNTCVVGVSDADVCLSVPPGVMTTRTPGWIGRVMITCMVLLRTAMPDAVVYMRRTTKSPIIQVAFPADSQVPTIDMVLGDADVIFQSVHWVRQQAKLFTSLVPVVRSLKAVLFHNGLLSRQQPLAGNMPSFVFTVMVVAVMRHCMFNQTHSGRFTTRSPTPADTLLVLVCVVRALALRCVGSVFCAHGGGPPITKASSPSVSVVLDPTSSVPKNCAAHVLCWDALARAMLEFLTIMRTDGVLL